jgi:predicted S18 family serine protease
MAHLDIDTDVLVAARTRLDAAAAALANAGTGFGSSDAEAAGDTALAFAVVDLFTAWAPAHQSLTTTLEMLGTALGHAAEVFEGAECVTADGLAGLLVPTPSASAGPRADRAV